jgi:hypothetical protein
LTDVHSFPAFAAVTAADVLGWSADQEDELYEECLSAALAMSAKEVTVKDYEENNTPLPVGWRARSARKEILASRKSEKEKAVEVNKTLSTWAEGNIRMGELILIIDSDTRVPVDCFLDGASEFDQSPELAILQHESGVMKVANHFFENGIAFFTMIVNLSISLVCANGDSAFPLARSPTLLSLTHLYDVPVVSRTLCRSQRLH